MQLFSKFKRIIPLLAIILIVLATSCNGSKKYGCPDHLFTPTLVH